ncbi:Peptidyl-prolyl cis-trans isomerase E, partial [Linum perenne]
AAVQKNKLYVGGLAEKVNESILQTAFIPFGDIKDVKTPLDQATQKHRLVFDYLFLALIPELYYLLCWKKRITNRERETEEESYTISNPKPEPDLERGGDGKDLLLAKDDCGGEGEAEEVTARNLAGLLPPLDSSSPVIRLASVNGGGAGLVDLLTPKPPALASTPENAKKKKAEDATDSPEGVAKDSSDGERGFMVVNWVSAAFGVGIVTQGSC